MQNKKGFTLLEMLLVMQVIIIISFISLRIINSNKNDKIVIEELNSFFLEAKLNSIINKETTKIYLNKHSLTYSSTNNNRTLYLKNISIDEATNFSYNELGHIYKAKTVNIYINQNNYHYVFQVGSGAFEVRKQR